MSVGEMRLSNEVTLKQDYILVLTNANKKRFIVPTEEIDLFLILLYNENEKAEKLITEKSDSKRQHDLWVYQEKPFRALKELITLDEYPIIFSMLGSQTKAIFSAIGLYINYFLGETVSSDSDPLPLDKDSLEKFISKKKLTSSDIEDSSFDISLFTNDLVRSHIFLPILLPNRFVFFLLTKPFIILTGLAGSGKTKLAEAFSLWISESRDQYCMVSVGADWTNREPLLGYPNALAQGEYIKPDCGALDLILRADADHSRPYFLILDEMNMSHVERYFADFLSAMESIDSIISLHPDGDGWEKCDVPATIALPKNLFIIGTVNIDETTYMFSPKVLDRANVIEFRVEKDDMEKFFDSPTRLNMEALRGAGSAMGKSFVSMAQAQVQSVSDLKDVLMPFFEKLQAAGAEFGYRTAAEISRFVAIYRDLNKDSKESIDDSKPVTNNSIIDAAIMQKLLPKLHGSRHKIEPVLRELAQLCLNNPSNEPFDGQLGDIRYPLSYKKLERMHKRVIADGFTSYAEA